ESTVIMEMMIISRVRYFFMAVSFAFFYTGPGKYIFPSLSNGLLRSEESRSLGMTKQSIPNKEIASAPSHTAFSAPRNDDAPLPLAFAIKKYIVISHIMVRIIQRISFRYIQRSSNT